LRRWMELHQQDRWRNLGYSKCRMSACQVSRLHRLSLH
jgi:hypothetical protein